MGIYLEPPVSTSKAQWLIDNLGATKLDGPNEEIGENDILICVVENGLFDAAGVMFNDQERDDFNIADDPRPRTWLSMRLGQVFRNDRPGRCHLGRAAARPRH